MIQHKNFKNMSCGSQNDALLMYCITKNPQNSWNCLFKKSIWSIRNKYKTLQRSWPRASNGMASSTSALDSTLPYWFHVSDAAGVIDIFISLCGKHGDIAGFLNLMSVLVLNQRRCLTFGTVYQRGLVLTVTEMCICSLIGQLCWLYLLLMAVMMMTVIVLVSVTIYRWFCGKVTLDDCDTETISCRLYRCCCIKTKQIWPEPEFLNILKCNSAESARTGFQFVMIFLIIKHLIIGICTTFQVC